MLPRKRGRVPWRKSLFSKDDSKLEEGSALGSGKGARGKGQRPFPRPALSRPSTRGSPDADCGSEWQLPRLRFPAPARDSWPAPNADSAVPVAAVDCCSAPPSPHSPLVPPPARTLRPVAAPSAVVGGNRLWPMPHAHNGDCARRDSARPDRHSPGRSSRSRPVPFACGELAAMIRMPSFAHIRPNCVTAGSPRSRSSAFGGRTYTFFQSVYNACGTP